MSPVETWRRRSPRHGAALPTQHHLVRSRSSLAHAAPSSCGSEPGPGIRTPHGRASERSVAVSRTVRPAGQVERDLIARRLTRSSARTSVMLIRLPQHTTRCSRVDVDAHRAPQRCCPHDRIYWPATPSSRCVALSSLSAADDQHNVQGHKHCDKHCDQSARGFHPTSLAQAPRGGALRFIRVLACPTSLPSRTPMAAPRSTPPVSIAQHHDGFRTCSGMRRMILIVPPSSSLRPEPPVNPPPGALRCPAASPSGARAPPARAGGPRR